MKTKGRQPVMLRLPTARGSCVGKSIHLLTGVEWNSSFIQLEAETILRGLV